MFSEALNKRKELHSEIGSSFDEIFKEAVIRVTESIQNEGTLFFAGNGGSAAESQHMSAEYIATLDHNKFRPGIKSISLTVDTSFITAYKNKNHDCIVGMYHDALQSGLKAFGFDKGVTVQGGLPVPITTPAHGTAFDIAGKNKANLEPTLNSFKIALTMAENKNN